MAWSTSQLAALAGTTVKTVRHYHQIGLLEEPSRSTNGYKQYGATHLVRLLQIRRFRDLRIPLAQIEEIEDSDSKRETTFRALDAELAETIERLQGVRADLANILVHDAPVTLPAGFGAVAQHPSAADQAMVLISSRLFDDTLIGEMRSILAEKHPIDAEFDALPADAAAETIADLAARIAPVINDLRAKHHAARSPELHALHGERQARSTIVQAMAELYNPAQLAVLDRANRILARPMIEPEG